MKVLEFPSRTLPGRSYASFSLVITQSCDHRQCRTDLDESFSGELDDVSPIVILHRSPFACH